MDPIVNLEDNLLIHVAHCNWSAKIFAPSKLTFGDKIARQTFGIGAK